MTLARRRVTDWLSLTNEEFSRARIAVLPVAAVEQHGPHLPVGTDTYIAEAYLARVRALLPEDLPVVLLPVQQVGASDEHRAFAGTLTLSPETALRAFIEIGESAHRAGIAKLVIVNSHGGNIALIDLAARQLRVRLNMLAVHASWGRFGYPTDCSPKRSTRTAFTAVTSRPRSCSPHIRSSCGARRLRT